MPSFFDELAYTAEDAFAIIDDWIVDTWNPWVVAFQEWLLSVAQASGPASGPNVPAGPDPGGSFQPLTLEPFARELWQMVVGHHPRADEQSLRQLAEYWQEQGEQTLRVAGDAAGAARGVHVTWQGDGAAWSFQERITAVLRAAESLVQTQYSLAGGVNEFAATVIRAKAAFWAQIVLLLFEIFMAVALAFPTGGLSVLLVAAKRFGMAAAVRTAVRKFLAELASVSFRTSIQRVGAGTTFQRLSWPGRARMLTGMGLRAPLVVTFGPLAAGARAGGSAARAAARELRPDRMFSPAWAAALRQSRQLQRGVVRERSAGLGLRAFGPPAGGRPAVHTVAAIRSPEFREELAGALVRELRNRDTVLSRVMQRWRGTPAPAPATEVGQLAAQLARDAVARGLTTWGEIGSAAYGYGVRSAVVYGAVGYALQEAMTAVVLAANGLSDYYQPHYADLVAALFAGGAGGAPLALGARVPEMAFWGGLGGGLGYGAAIGAQLLLHPDVTVETVLGGEPFTWAGLLRAGGADTLVGAVTQGAIFGGVWERFIGQAGLDEVRQAFRTLDVAWHPGTDTAPSVVPVLDGEALLAEPGRAEADGEVVPARRLTPGPPPRVRVPQDVRGLAEWVRGREEALGTPESGAGGRLAALSDRQVGELVRAVVGQAAGAPGDAAAWKPVEGGWLLQGHDRGEGYVVQVDEQGRVIDLWPGGFEPRTVTDAAMVRSVLWETLPPGTELVDAERGVFRVPVDGGELRLRLGVDPALPERTQVVGPVRLVAGESGWSAEATVALSATTRASPAEQLADLPFQLRRAVATIVADLPVTADTPGTPEPTGLESKGHPDATGEVPGGEREGAGGDHPPTEPGGSGAGGSGAGGSVAPDPPGGPDRASAVAPGTRAGLLLGAPMGRLPRLDVVAEHLNRQFQRHGVDHPPLSAVELDRLLQAQWRELVSTGGARVVFGQRRRREFLVRIDVRRLEPVSTGVTPVRQTQHEIGRGQWAQETRAGRATHVRSGFVGQGLIPYLVRAGWQQTWRQWLGQTLSGESRVEPGIDVADHRGPATPHRADATVLVCDLAAGEEVVFATDPGDRDPAESLVVAVPDGFDGPTPATGRAPGRERLPPDDPPRLLVLDWTARARIVDWVMAQLPEQVAGDKKWQVRDQVWQRVGELPRELATAGAHPAGHPFPVVSDGVVVAVVRVHTDLLREQATAVGPPSRGAHLERTSNTVEQVSGVTALGRQRESGPRVSVGVPEWLREQLPDWVAARLRGLQAGGQADFLRGSGAVSELRTGSGAERITVDRWTGETQAHAWGDLDDPEREPGVRHRVTVWTRERDRPAAETFSAAMITLVREPDAYRYGLPVAQEAIDEDGSLRRNAPGRDDGDGPPVPGYLARRRPDGTVAGTGAGTAIVDDLWAAPHDAAGGRFAPRDAAGGRPGPPRGAAPGGGGDRLAALRESVLSALRAVGAVPDAAFQPGRDSAEQVIASLRDGTWQNVNRAALARNLRVLNALIVEGQLSAASAAAAYDQLSQDGVRLRLPVLRPEDPTREVGYYCVDIALTQHLPRARFKRYTTERALLSLDVDDGSAETADLGRVASRWLAEVRGGYTSPEVDADGAPRPLAEEAGAGADQPASWEGGVSGGRGPVQSATLGTAERTRDIRFLEHTGPLAVWDVPHTISVTVRDQDGNVVPGGDELTYGGGATLYVPADLADATAPQPAASGPEVGGLLAGRDAVVTAVDVTGLRAAAQEAVAEAGGRDPRRARTHPSLEAALAAMTGVTAVRSRIGELLTRGYHHDQLFQAGAGHTRYGVTLAGAAGRTRLLGTPRITVLGRMVFRLREATAGVGKATARLFSALGAADDLGDLPGTPDGVAGTARGETGRTRFGTLRQGVERILSNYEERRFHFETELDWRVEVLADTGEPAARREVPGRVSWLLSESEVVEAYRDGVLDQLPTAEVAASLHRWREGRLRLDREVAAGAVHRLVTTQLARGEAPDQPLLWAALARVDPDPAAVDPGSLPPDLAAEMLLDRLGSLLDEPATARAESSLVVAHQLPEETFGCSTVRDFQLFTPDGESVRPVAADETLAGLLHRAVPGLLDRVGAEVVAARIGRLPGVRRALDTLSAGGRLRGPLESMLSGGYEFLDTTVGRGVLGTLGQRLRVVGTLRPLTVDELREQGWSEQQVRAYRRALGHIRGDGPEVTRHHDRVGIENQSYALSQLEHTETKSAAAPVATGQQPDLGAGADTTAGAATARGRSTEVTAEYEDTYAVHQGAPRGAYGVTVPMAVTFEVQAGGLGGRPVSNAVRRLAELPARRRGTRPARVDLVARLDLWVPDGTVTEPELATPDRGEVEYRRFTGLPARVAATGESAPMREAVLTALHRLLGRDAEQLRPLVAARFSPEGLAGSLPAFASEQGASAFPLPRTPLRSAADQSVSAQVRVRFTALEMGPLLAEEHALGALHRHLEKYRQQETRTRPLPLTAQGRAEGDSESELGPALDAAAAMLEGLEDLTLGATLEVGTQATHGVRAVRGRRQDTAGLERGPVRLVRVRYTTDVDAERHFVSFDGEQHRPPERYALRDTAPGTLRLWVYERDLPELRRRVAAGDPRPLATSADIRRAGGAGGEALAVARERAAPVLDLEALLAEADDGGDLDLRRPEEGAARAARRQLPGLRPGWDEQVVRRRYGVEVATVAPLVRVRSDPTRERLRSLTLLAARVAETMDGLSAYLPEPGPPGPDASAATRERPASAEGPVSDALWTEVAALAAEATARAAALAAEATARAAALAEANLRFARARAGAGGADLPAVHRRWLAAVGDSQRLVEAATEAVWLLEDALAQRTDAEVEAARAGGEYADPVAAARAGLRRLDELHAAAQRLDARPPWQDLDRVALARGLASELSAEVLLEVAEPSGDTVGYRITPDGEVVPEVGTTLVPGEPAPAGAPAATVESPPPDPGPEARERLEAGLADFFARLERQDRAGGAGAPGDVVGARRAGSGSAAAPAWAVTFRDGTRVQVRFRPSLRGTGRLAVVEPTGEAVVEVPTLPADPAARRLMAGVHTRELLRQVHDRLTGPPAQ